MPISEGDLTNTTTPDTNSTQTHIAYVDSEFTHSLPLCREERQMVTRSQKGIVKLNTKYAILTNISFNTEPKNLNAALSNPIWLEAMHDELRALGHNQTWDLAPGTSDMNVMASE